MPRTNVPDTDTHVNVMVRSVTGIGSRKTSDIDNVPGAIDMDELIGRAIADAKRIKKDNANANTSNRTDTDTGTTCNPVNYNHTCTDTGTTCNPVNYNHTGTGVRDNHVNHNHTGTRDNPADDAGTGNPVIDEMDRTPPCAKKYSVLLNGFDAQAESAMDGEEELLNPSNDRLVLKPINPKFKVIWELYKKQAEAFWTPEKIDFSKEKYDFVKLPEDVQIFIKRVLAFFAGADSIVNVNIQRQFSKITVKEANVAYAFQEMMENIHSEVYSDMLDNIIVNPEEKKELINAFKTVESIEDMIGWGQAWVGSERRIGFSIMAFTIFEGLMFSSAFAAIYWLKHQLPDDKMQGLIGSNEFIARDEGMHTNFGCLMYDYVINRLTVDEATIMMTEGVDIAKRFIEDALPVRLIGMNEGLMGEYIEYVADRLMVYLGYEKIYGTQIPEAFAYMEQIGVLNKNNFFERRTSEYQMAHHKDNTADWKFRILKKY